MSEPLAVVRRLYEAWNAGDVAAAATLLSPAVRWESFRESRPVEGPEGLQATLAGASSGGTWRLSPVAVDLLVCVVNHVIAFSRRIGAQGETESQRVEVWTLRDGTVVHYRGFPLDEGLAVLSETTGSRRLEALCRGVLAFNRGEVEGWLEELGGGGLPGQRLDDVRVLAESGDALVVSAVHHRPDPSRGAPVAEQRHLVIRFAGDQAQRVSGHATPEVAVAAATGSRPG